MSLKVNIEPSGIIWQARHHMATSSDVKPLDKNAVGFEYYAIEMVNARRKHENLDNEETVKALDHLHAESVFNPIGRLLTQEQDLPSGKRLTTYLTLLNESIGIMPDYPAAKEGARKIGRVTVLLHNIEQHRHAGSGAERYQSAMAGGLDILTDGSVNMSSFSLVTCADCWYFDLKDESRILNRFGLETLYLDQKKHEISRDLGKRSCVLTNQQFNESQVAELQLFLMEQFTPTTE